MFVLSLPLNLVGLMAMLAIAGLIGPRRRARSAGAPAEPPPAPVDPRALRYLIVVTAGPLALAMIGALLSGSNLRSAWGSSMFNLAGLLGIAFASSRFDDAALRRIAICAGALLVAVPLGYALAMAIGPSRAGAPARVSWPQAELAERFAAIWSRETGQPLRIISGDSWIAGLIGVTAKDRPSIFTRGDPALSPWITPERLEREGMLVVWDARTKNVPERLQSIVDASSAREERFGWRWSKKRGDLAIGYVIVPPKPPPR